MPCTALSSPNAFSIPRLLERQEFKVRLLPSGPDPVPLIMIYEVLLQALQIPTLTPGNEISSYASGSAPNKDIAFELRPLLSTVAGYRARRAPRSSTASLANVGKTEFCRLFLY